MSGLSGWLVRTWYSRRPVWFFIPLAWLFGFLSALRRMLFGLGVFRVVMAPVPVIVVGNIAVGGTGKTPFTVWLATALGGMGYKVGIVTRGYGSGDATLPILVTPDSDAHAVGDEAVLLARRTGLPVASCVDRPAAAELLASRYPLDVILSDDGLQHYRMARAMEIVLLDGERGLGNHWLLPAGPLRETEQRLAQVDLVIIKRTGAAQFTWPDAVYMPLATDTAVSLVDGRRVPLRSFAGQAVHAFAGIGNPGQFFGALEQAGLRVTGHPLPDHAVPSPADLDPPGSAPVFMTEKDAVKCGGKILSRHWYVEATAAFTREDRDRILGRLEQVLAKRRMNQP